MLVKCSTVVILGTAALMLMAGCTSKSKSTSRSAAPSSGPVTGRIEGDTLRLRLDSGAVGPEVRVQGDTMTGMVSGEPLNVRRAR